ncbi:hypothetical protein CDAR_189071 [Caerostris darwini]|uniref:Uncharacterized protein n=1 Tax=Caerostris darwini TaxID=1538125 RepID=A0AAV4SS71_9ARAC|nr:hypothetical protein CDAR_189071 [Caerostris darwini]
MVRNSGRSSRSGHQGDRRSVPFEMGDFSSGLIADGEGGCPQYRPRKKVSPRWETPFDATLTPPSPALADDIFQGTKSRYINS